MVNPTNSKNPMIPLSKQEKEKILSRLFWDVETNKIEVEKLLDEKIRTIDQTQSQTFFTKLLTSCDWYTLIKLLPPAKLNLILTDQILDRLFPKDLKQKYTYARQVLSRHTLSISGKSSLINTDLIISKAAAVKKRLSRIKSKADVDLETFLADIDIQEIVLFNLQMAIQNCIDIAAQIIIDENLGVAASNNEMFFILEENAFLTPDLTEKMVQAIGLFNLITYEFDKVDQKKVLNLPKKDVDDLNDFLKAIIQKTKIHTKLNKPKEPNRSTNQNAQNIYPGRKASKNPQLSQRAPRPLRE